MLQAALWYAKRGWHVFPLHAPLFDAGGACVGCTCEAWKRTHYNKPDYKCPQPGKCPAVKWADKSTTEPEQIRKWFDHQWKAAHPETGATIYFTPNLGIDCGKSGLLAFDADAYKDTYGGADLLSLADKQTVTSLTGGGGEHLFYAMPPGKAYGNAKGTLPAGVDIRGAGGYIVAPPSLHKSGRRYQFEEGYKPSELDLLPIPQALQAILEAAQATQRTAQPVTFAMPTTQPPSLLQWRISKEIRELISAPGVPGKRSENDYSACLSLLYAGANDDDILAVFQHLPIGTAGKFAEAGPAYLARTIGKARTFMEAHPRPDVAATVAHMRRWIKTHNLSERLPSKKVRPVFDAVLDAMQAEGQLTVTIGKKRLAALAGVAVNTAAKVLALLNGRLLNVTPTEYGHTIELPAASLVVDCRFAKFDPLLNTVERTPTIVYRGGGQILQNDKNDYSAHKADDAFLTGTSRHMKDRIKQLATVLDVTYPQAKADYTFAGLGEGVLLAYDTSRRVGDLTAQAYAEETGLKLAAARTHLRRAETMGLATADREGSRGPKVYTFAPDFWQRVDDLAPNLRTYNMSSQRENKRLEAAQQWTKAEMDKAKQAGEVEKAEELKACFDRKAEKRIPHLKRLNPDLSARDIMRLAYDVAAYKRSPQTAQAIYAERTAQRTEHRETIALIRDLAVAIADVGTPSAAVFAEIMQYGFDPILVKQVLQSPVQMADYETVEDVRVRMLHEDLTPATIVAAVPVIDYQLRLAGI